MVLSGSDPRSGYQGPPLARIIAVKSGFGTHAAVAMRRKIGLGLSGVWDKLEPFNNWTALGRKRAMDVRATSIPGVQVLKPRYFHDPRGYFVETYNKQRGPPTWSGGVFCSRQPVTLNKARNGSCATFPGATEVAGKACSRVARQHL